MAEQRVETLCRQEHGRDNNMKQNGYNVELTKEMAVQLHREMWQFIKDYIEVSCVNDRVWSRTKAKMKFVDSHGFSDVASYCFACEYGKQQSGEERCNSCPFDWGDNTAEYCYCETAGNIDWRTSPIDDIINVKVRDNDVPKEG
jgi:hypothetical protein